jgi:hypothetical protein
MIEVRGMWPGFTVPMVQPSDGPTLAEVLATIPETDAETDAEISNVLADWRMS